MPGPIRFFRTLIQKMTDTRPEGATLPQHIFASLKVAMSGYLIGVLVGVPLGIAMAWYKKVDLFVRPVFDLMRPIPGLAWIPVMIVLFGIGLLSKAMVIFLTAFISVVINSYSGIKQTKDVHLWVGQTFGASNTQLLFKVAIPTALPLIMTGLRVALGASWTCLVASSIGLGYMIQFCRGIYRPDVIIAGMISIGAIGALLSYLLTFIEKKILKGERWQ